MNKENCYTRPTAKRYFDYLRAQFDEILKVSGREKKNVLNGCICWGCNLNFAATLRQFDTKPLLARYILQFRNGADRAWMGYNEQCHPQIIPSDLGTCAQRVIPGQTIRSAEHFHDLVMNLTYVGFATSGEDEFIRAIQRYRNEVRHANLLFLAMEESLFEPFEYWSKLSNFTGLHFDDKFIEKASQVRVNSGDLKADHPMSSASKDKYGRYAASNYTDMFESTRELLSILLLQECKSIKSATGYSYRGCNGTHLSFHSVLNRQPPRC